MYFYYAIVFASFASVALSQHATICDEVRLNTFIPDVRDCSAWFFCGNNGPVRGVCSNGLLFNPNTRLCDRQENVECFQCRSNGGLDKFAMNGSCRSFIRCINGSPFQSICEDGLHFNENTGQCDFPDAVNCRSGFRCPAELPIDGIVAMRDNYNCSVYHLCIGQPEAVRQECNSELHFDSASNLCTFPELTFCPIRQHPGGPGLGPGDSDLTTLAPTTISTSTASPTTTTTEATTTAPTTTESTTTTAPTTTESTTTTAPTTTESTTTTTAPTTIESTTAAPTTTQPTSTTPQPVFVCPSDGLHPHPTECSEYFICAANVPHLMRCADGLHFDAYHLRCDFIENARCDLYTNSIDYL